MSTEPVHLRVVPAAPAPGARRADLVRRARRLAWLGVGWHVAEAAVAIAAGLAAGSIALVGFGADSFVETLAGVVVLWRLGGGRATSATAERRALRLIAASFAVLAGYVAVEAVRTLVAGAAPEASPVGLVLAAVTATTMPLLAAAKARAGAALGSAAVRSEGRQNLVCAYLSVALLVGLGANALLDWWWADPVAALAVAGVALREGRAAWRGQPCGCCA